jgi:hypothetical protein
MLSPRLISTKGIGGPAMLRARRGFWMTVPLPIEILAGGPDDDFDRRRLDALRRDDRDVVEFLMIVVTTGMLQ